MTHFGVEVNENLIHMAVVQHLETSARHTEAKTRGRSPEEQKALRQKEPHARRFNQAPQWKGGGVVRTCSRDYS